GHLRRRVRHREHRVQLRQEPVHAFAIGLVHHEDVRDLHDPRLEGLHFVAEAGHEHDQAHVHGPDDLDLALAYADRLHEHDVLPGGVEHGDGVGGGGGQAAQVAARRHRADEDAVVHGMGLHTDAVAQYRPT